jgi:hypothetical protein
MAPKIAPMARILTPVGSRFHLSIEITQKKPADISAGFLMLDLKTPFARQQRKESKRQRPKRCE